MMKKPEETGLGRRTAADLRRKAEERVRGKAKSAEGLTEADVRASWSTSCRCIRLNWRCRTRNCFAQAALQEVSDNYRDLFDFAPVGYFRLDEQGRILEVNLAGASLLGLERSTALGQPVAQYVAIPSYAPFAEFFADMLRADGKQTREIELQRGGHRVCTLLEGIRAADAAGNRTFCVTATDITERKRLGQTIKDHEEELLAIYENAPIIMLLVDDQHRVCKVNQFAKQFTGASDAELIGRRGGEALRCACAG